MKRLLYIFKRILKMDYKNMFATVKAIHKKTGKNSIWLFFDMVKCGLKYGAGYKDYKLNEFYNLNSEQRATYVTRGINNTIVSRLNPREHYHIIENKTEFNRRFSDFLGREWLDFSLCSKEEFCEFAVKQKIIIAKPKEGTCGMGVEKLSVSDYSSAEKLYEHLKENNCGLVEECLAQHEDINKIYPLSVNTLRVVTVRGRDNKCHIVYAFIRIGNKGKYVDNINNGGMCAPIDLETGKIKYAAFDKDSVYYEVHPETNCTIAGYQLPFFKESAELCIKAAESLTELGYVGWDVAVKPDGPTLIEGNHFPGHDILQMPPHVPDKIGMLPRFREFINI